MRVGVFVFPWVFYVSFPWIFWTFKGSAKTLTKTYPRRWNLKTSTPNVSWRKIIWTNQTSMTWSSKLLIFSEGYTVYTPKKNLNSIDMMDIWHPVLFFLRCFTHFLEAPRFSKKNNCCQRSATPVGWKNMGQSYTSKELPSKERGMGPITGGSPRVPLVGGWWKDG